MAFFARVLNLIPIRRSAADPTTENQPINNEKSGSDDTDATRQGTDTDLEQQREDELTELQEDNLDRRRNVRTLPRKTHIRQVLERAQY
jgi:hypothetical protein